MSVASPTISVRAHGSEIGFIIICSDHVEAFGLDGQSIGVFPSKDDAARALWRHDRTTIGATARVAQNLSPGVA
jgi:hypothetical protein